MNKRLPGMLMEVLLSAEEGQRNSAGPFKRLEGMTVLQGNRRGSSGLSDCGTPLVKRSTLSNHFDCC